MKFFHGLTLYSFAGWIIEELYQKITCGTFKKANFSWLPFKPMYGIAAMLLVPLKSKGYKLRVAGFLLIPAAVEFISGYWLKRDFGLTYWDYGREKGNINGLICPKFLFYWGVLSYVLVEWVQPWLERAFDVHRKLLEPLLSSCAVVFLTDMQCNLWRRYHQKRIGH